MTVGTQHDVDGFAGSSLFDNPRRGGAIYLERVQVGEFFVDQALQLEQPLFRLASQIFGSDFNIINGGQRVSNAGGLGCDVEQNNPRADRFRETDCGINNAA
jgi:hypothetical protein